MKIREIIDKNELPVMVKYPYGKFVIISVEGVMATVKYERGHEAEIIIDSSLNDYEVVTSEDS